MDNNLPTTNFQVQKLYDDSSKRAEKFKDTHIMNFPSNEFKTLIDVDKATQSNIIESLSFAYSVMPKDSNECLINMKCAINTTEITRLLLKNAVDNCIADITISEELVNTIAKSLAAAIYGPMLENGVNTDRTIYSLVPAIVMKSDTGELKAFAVGQLVADDINNSNMIIIVRGCAVDNQSRQIITDSITQSMLPVNEISI
ncbi:uncharacterized protein LOC6568025 isoform X2 [Drosophila grimshawi]|uniref:uncharacterized protein LOC6568025 isoform X2 n=1 Tax=Drosophila grimshawi TaxID=7222 RepID=UPI000C86EF38|nr:uncharacterized protein LOC6568025 isoform X2 [Drosophila grimshawi]